MLGKIEQKNCFIFVYRTFSLLPAPVPPLPFRQPLYPHLPRQYLKGQLKAPTGFSAPATVANDRVRLLAWKC